MRLPHGILSDACPLSAQTGIPAFVVLDDARLYRITELRPSPENGSGRIIRGYAYIRARTLTSRASRLSEIVG
jgi:hypothetical protein